MMPNPVQLSTLSGLPPINTREGTSYDRWFVNKSPRMVILYKTKINNYNFEFFLSPPPSLYLTLSSLQTSLWPSLTACSVIFWRDMSRPVMTSDDLSPDLCRGETGLSLSLSAWFLLPLCLTFLKFTGCPPSLIHTQYSVITLPCLPWSALQ